MAPVIAIDGVAGSGKSTLARSLALALDLPYVNTGSMYRALTRAALDQGVDLDDEAALVGITRRLRFRLRDDTKPRELEIEGYADRDLATATVDAAVSRAARHPAVRALMRDAQRSLGAGGAVMEGRDIGTVVFPDAQVKLFLRADPAARGTRRTVDRAAPEGDVVRALHERDERDALVNPLRPAPDAILIDTTDAGPQETLASVLSIVRGRRP